MSIEDIIAKCNETKSDTLDLSDIEIKKLPILPEHIKILMCSRNGLEELPELLPPNLEKLCVIFNSLTKLPELPKTLNVLYIFGNKIEKLPELPDSLIHINCDDNQIVRLPEKLPMSIKSFSFERNNIINLPTIIPDNLLLFGYRGNRYLCVPKKHVSKYNMQKTLNYHYYANKIKNKWLSRRKLGH